VQVHDTGCGIAPGEQRIIFREFKRLHAGEDEEPGLGLGLSIVERIGQVLSHPVAVRSQPQRGSAFSIELPLGDAAMAARRPVSTRAPQATALDGLRVLCIDNERQILDGMTVLLEGWGCSVVSAISAGKALATVKEHDGAIDLVIADYHLGRGNGLALVAQIRERLGHEVPAVLVTADRDRSLQEQARAMGVGFLNKPVRPAALRATLSRARLSAQAAE
jgi:CheY-like chemotaxis protein